MSMPLQSQKTTEIDLLRVRDDDPSNAANSSALFAARRNIASIQVLRGLAALLVVGFHLTPRFAVGSAGVDIFFVISGFIMGMVGKNERPTQFLIKRLSRIAPLYWLVTATMCLGAMMGLFRGFTFNSRTILLSSLFIPYFNPQGKIWPLLVPGWTLNYEMFFYAVFALGLLLRRPVATVLVILILATTCGAFGDYHNAIWLTWTSPLLLEFLAGLLLSQVDGRFLSVRIGIALLALGIAGFALAGPVRQMLGGDFRVMTWGIPALLLVSGAIAIEYAGYWPQKLGWPVQKVGDCSYSLYLVHGLVIAIGHRFVGDTVISAALLVAASIAIATLTFHGIEKPMARWARQLLMRLTALQRGAVA